MAITKEANRLLSMGKQLGDYVSHPLNTMVMGSGIASGDQSVGNAVGGVVGGMAGFDAVGHFFDKYVPSKPRVAPSVTKAPGFMNTMRRFASGVKDIPAALAHGVKTGRVFRFPAQLAGATILASSASSLMDKYAPIWRRKPALDEAVSRLYPKTLK